MRIALPAIALTIDVFVLLIYSAGANAALIDNGGYTSDSVSGLDWLDLTATLGQNRIDALASNNGWRHATNSEVEDLFWQSFDGYYETNSLNYSSTLQGAYADQVDDIYTFGTLLGAYDGRSIGLYADEDGVIRLMGTYSIGFSSSYAVYGPEFTNAYDNVYSSNVLGTYLVRATVPLPAAVWLLGSALGLMGAMRRKLTT